MPENETIVRYAIYPGVGIARVGNAPEDYFIGPEAPGQMPQAVGGFKDAEGRVKRQAARFRIYGLNEAGSAVKEITAETAEITWRVHLANRKSGWYQFNNAMDLGDYAMEARDRNQDVLGDERETLIIDSGSCNISGRQASGRPPATTAGWHDERCGAPAPAPIKIDGKEYEAEPAMVAVTPPNFGPGL